MKRVLPLNYAFAVGKIRALEKFLIKQGVFEEAIDSSLNDALRLFVEANLYSDELLHIKNGQQLEDVLNQETTKLKTMIKGLLLDRGLLGLLELDTIRCADEILKCKPGEFLENFLRHLIDMHNIKTFVRLHTLKEPQAVLESMLSCEGFIKKGNFIRFYNEEIKVFVNSLEYVHKHNRLIDYAQFLTEPIEKAQAQHSFIGLEKAINDFLIEILKPAKYITFGPQPVLAYYFAKRSEIDLVRMVILAKLNDISGDLIRERLSIVYA